MTDVNGTAGMGWWNTQLAADQEIEERMCRRDFEGFEGCGIDMRKQGRHFRYSENCRR